MGELVTLTAGSHTAVAGVDVGSPSRLTAWDWGTAKPKATLAEGAEGSRRAGESDYEDRQVTFSVERAQISGDTELASRQWVAAWARAAAAASREDSATLVFTSATGSTLTFDVLTAEVAVKDRGGVLWHRGIAELDVTLQCRPFARGDEATLSGSLASVNGMSVWTASGAVGGDVPALAEVTATFGEARPQMTVSALPAAPTVIVGNTLAALSGTSTSVAGPTGSGNTNTRRFTLSPTSALTPITSFVPATSGRYHVVVRANGSAGNAGSAVALMVGSRPVAQRSLPADSGWVPLRFGAHDLTAGETCYLAAQQFSQLYVDWISLAPDGGPAAVVESRPPAPPLMVAGDDAAQSTVTSGGSINGATGVFGGVWSASGWTRVVSGANAWFAAPDGAAGSIGTVQRPFRATWDVAKAATVVPPTLNVAGLVSGLGPYSDRDTRIVLEVNASGQWRLDVFRVGSTVPWYSANGPTTGWATPAPVSITHVQGSSGLAARRITKAQVEQLSVYPTAVTWDGSGDGELVMGGHPTFAPGSTPRVAVVAGGPLELVAGGYDRPGVAGPSAVTVKATPRHLQVPVT